VKGKNRENGGRKNGVTKRQGRRKPVTKEDFISGWRKKIGVKTKPLNGREGGSHTGTIISAREDQRSMIRAAIGKKGRLEYRGVTQRQGC